MKQFLLGLVVALVCGTTVAAEGFWVCEVNWPDENMIVNLHADRMVLFNGDVAIDGICSNNVCINKQVYGEDDITLRILNIYYQDDKPFSMMFSRVDLDKKLDKINTKPEAFPLSKCAQF